MERFHLPFLAAFSILVLSLRLAATPGLLSNLNCHELPEPSYQKSKRAVVVGISMQEDSLLPTIPANRQNAEVFAAFLRSREGGLLPVDHIQLLTEEQATMASFAAAFDWLSEESQIGDHITLYFSGNARLINSEYGPMPYLFFADSPMALGRAGSLPLSRLCYWVQEIASKKNLQFNLIFNLNMGDTSAESDDIWRQWLEGLQKSFPFAWLEDTFDKPFEQQPNMSGFSPVLLDGMIGAADLNGNELITPKEIGKYLRSNRKKVPGGHALLLAFSDDKTPISKIDGSRGLKADNPNHPQELPSLVRQDFTRLEDSLVAAADERTRQWYLDFVLTMKLGKLMNPSGRCTSDLYDSLLTQKSIQPLHSHLRRQLAAALQDETQQALNDYLRTDTRELQRRWKHSGNYATYPEYMLRTVELLGEKHFMFSISQCKRYYFEGLTARLDYEKDSIAQLLDLALEKQQLALKYEPDAAFVLNELGIVYFLQDNDTAKSFYLHAINLAPQWGIPYLNIAFFHHKNEEFDSALVYAQLAVELAPWNPVAVFELGLINLRLNRFSITEEWLRRAASIDPTNASVYYNLSCAKALQGQTEPALQWLELSLKYGFNNIDYLKKDPDLAVLHNTKQLDELLKKYFPLEVRD